MHFKVTQFHPPSIYPKVFTSGWVSNGTEIEERLCNWNEIKYDQVPVNVKTFSAKEAAAEYCSPMPVVFSLSRHLSSRGKPHNLTNFNCNYKDNPIRKECRKRNEERNQKMRKTSTWLQLSLPPTRTLDDNTNFIIRTSLAQFQHAHAPRTSR